MTRPLRIFVASSANLLTDYRPHGEGLIAWSLLSGLAKRGHELVVCTRHADIRAAVPFEVLQLGRGSRFESVEPFAYARRVKHAFERAGGVQSFDAVHWLFPQEPQELVYAPPRNIPFVTGPHFPAWPRGTRTRSLRAGDAVRFALRPLFAQANRRALTRAQRVLLANADALAALPRAARGKTQVLPPGVDATRFLPSGVPTAPRVLFVGSLEPSKGVRELIEAFALTRTKVPAAALVFAGDGGERNWIESRGRDLDLDGSLTVVGRVAHERIPELMRDAALVCVPAHGEPHGMALLEAMASGRAVVAVDAAGPRHFIDERGGRLVPAGDAAALSRALTGLLREPRVLAELGAHNRMRVETELSLERTLDSLEAVYREVTA